MNQHDKYPLHPEQQLQLRNGAIIALIAIALFCVVVVFGGCAEKDPLPTPEEMIVGAWERKWLTFTNTYSFDGNGQALAYAIIPGQPVQLYAYKYWFTEDTLSLIDLSVSKPFRDTSRAVVSFTDSGDTSVLSWLNGVDYYLTRI